ncbi:MAG TPA: hypothetical protein VLB86_01830 [Gaiellaceae bacterium]|nr:hypothetical protein [Gaiellaceae bacterium]
MKDGPRHALHFPGETDQVRGILKRLLAFAALVVAGALFWNVLIMALGLADYWWLLLLGGLVIGVGASLVIERRDRRDDADR